MNPSIAEAIFRVETAHGTSTLFVEYNNFGGMCNGEGFMSFATKDAGLEAFISMLERNNVPLEVAGIEDIREIAKWYCPANVDYWTNLVWEVYNECNRNAQSVS